jgi:hypothetical protein
MAFDLTAARVAVLALVIAALPAQGAPLTLGCSGTMTTTSIPKNGVASDPEKENVTDFSIVVDLDRHAVSGFWTDPNPKSLFVGVQSALPITAADTNAVYFEASRKDSILSKHISGSVDRITGAISAWDSTDYPAYSTSQTWDLHCKPTRPLF